MIFDHMVKYGGKYYNTGEDVPIEDEQARAEETPLPLSDTDITLEADSAVKEKKYTKTEINRMDKADLQALAFNSGIKDADGMTGTELKTALIDLLVK